MVCNINLPLFTKFSVKSVLLTFDSKSWDFFPRGMTRCLLFKVGSTLRIKTTHENTVTSELHLVLFIPLS